MTTDIAVASNGTLAVAGDQHEWTPAQRAAFAHIGIEDAPDADKQVFHHVCQLTGLDPYRKQIYMIARQDKGKAKWTIQTGIDGFRVIAEDHPQYAGTLDPEWCGDDGVWRETWTDRRPPVMARVKVLRHDRAHPITLPVRFNEFAAAYADGNLQGQWKTKPAHMIAKVAEAAALRKAFPRQLAGVYTDDEMAHVDNQGRGRRGAVIEQDAQPVTAAELTGQPARVAIEHDTAPVPADELTEPPAPPAATSAAPAAGDRMSQQQQSLLFALLGKAEIEDRKEWASGILGREITSYGQLSQGDASTLIDRLQEGLAALNGGDQ